MKQKYINDGQTPKVYCECGGEYNKKHESRHLKTKKHTAHKKDLEEQWVKRNAEVETESEDELCARLDAEYEADLEAKVEAQ